jgi:hypothetical protein
MLFLLNEVSGGGGGGAAVTLAKVDELLVDEGDVLGLLEFPLS